MSLKWWVLIAAGVGVSSIVLYYRLAHRGEVKFLTGVVLTDAADPGKQFPVDDAKIAVSLTGSNLPPLATSSDSSGLFHLTLHHVHAGDPIAITLRHQGYRPLDLTQPAASRLYVIRMISIASAAGEQPQHPPTTPVATLGNLKVRYSVENPQTVNVGSAAKVFQVSNTGDVPCVPGAPCSPDGKWKASVGGASLDAGEGNEFRDARVSCIAGPCPFTSVRTDGFSRGGQTISVSVEDWSDTVTFLMEAEVTRIMMIHSILESFPAISAPSMDFTLPPTAQGPSIEADVNGHEVFFPLGPTLDLSWATCQVKVIAGRNKLYHCDLKPGYQFKPPGSREAGS